MSYWKEWTSMDNRFGRQSVLMIETEFKENKTRLKDSYFTSPFKIAKPFYMEDGSGIEVCVMNASAGILEGDSYSIKLDLHENSILALTSQSFTKIHKMNGGFARQNISINLERGAILKFLPQPAIPFAGSRFFSRMKVNMERDSILLFTDVLSCGRYKRGEKFSFEDYNARTEIFYEGKLIFVDNLMLKPKIQDICGMGFYEGYTHQATIMVFGEMADEKLNNTMHNILSRYGEIEFGVTKTYKNGILARILGNGAERLKIILSEVCRHINTNLKENRDNLPV